MKGKNQILLALEDGLKIKLGETTPDKKFTLLATNCLGWCHKAPAMLINDDVFTELTPEMVRQIIEDYKKRFEEWGIDYSLVGDAHVRPLRGGRKIFLADFKTMLRKVISPEQYENKVLNLAIGDELSFANITGFLTDGGYERVKNLSDIGEFSIKGDLLEIFCFDGKYRLEFLGDRVEKIMIVGSGRDRSLQNVKIYPRNIDEGNDFLIKYFKNNILIFDGEDNLRSSVFSILVGKEGKISPEDIKKIKEIEDFVKRQKTIYLESFAVDESGGLPALPAQAGQAGRLNLLAKEARCVSPNIINFIK